MFNTILVPTDGSKLSQKAEQQAILLAKITGANVIALHIYPKFAGGPYGTYGPAEEILAEETRATARVTLKEGIDLYTAGDYNASLKRLMDSKEIWTTDMDIQLDALKYTAFSYCLTNRPSLCKLQFERALKMNKDLDLLPGEKGHPLWGPVFERAKKSK